MTRFWGHILATLMLLSALFSTFAEAVLPPSETGDFYVSSNNGNEIVVYDSTGSYLRRFMAAGLGGPRGVVFAPNGKLYVASQNTDEVFVFDDNDE